MRVRYTCMGTWRWVTRSGCGVVRVPVSLCGAVVVRVDALRCWRGGLARCYCVTIVTLYVGKEQKQRRRYCAAVACGNFGNFPCERCGVSSGCVCKFAVAVRLATACGSMYFEHVYKVAALDSQSL